MISQTALAGALGYLSIAFWLCAQLPQVIKNATLRSCEGLALPFLINWLFGDITNLIGCVLTDQLPFQTYLAAYFCVIDFALVYQFFYYRSVNPPAPASQPPLTSYPAYTPAYTPSPSLHASLILPHSDHGHPSRAASHPGGPRTRSISSSAVQPLSSLLHPPDSAISGASDVTARPRIRRTGTTHGSSSTLESPGLYADRSYAAIYEAALDVARTAERVSARRSQSRRRRLSRQTTARQTTTSDEEAGEGMMASFHSEITARSGASSSSTIEGDYRRMMASTGALLDTRDARSRRDKRGRSLRRQPSPAAAASPYESEDQATPLAHAGPHTPGHSSGQEGYSDEARKERKRDKSRSLSLARGSSGRGGRRAAGVAFMSLGLVARGWYGTYSPSPPVWASPSSSSGSVLARPALNTASLLHPPVHAYPARRVGSGLADVRSEMRSDGTTFVWIQDDHSGGHDHDRDHGIPDQPFSFQRIIGRISAWACTTLYLTSRLPQIWKNFQRKSVEGLSILLFLFAFCGNLSYVVSILLNPSGSADPSEAGHYLLEALPYLLGSGGTLLFDLTIMIQSALYGSAKPISALTSKRLRLSTGRRKWKHPEDGVVHTRVMSGSNERLGASERSPLLNGHQSQRPTHTRGRSSSPDTVMKYGPGDGR